MRNGIAGIFLLIGCWVHGQELSAGTVLQWMAKADKQNVVAHLQSNGYRLIGEKDSLELHYMDFSIVKTENGTQPHARLFLSDSAVEWISFDTYAHNEQKNTFAQLKAQRFKTLDARVNGDFVTTTFDNDQYLADQNYMVIENPLGKGQLPYYQFCFYRKYGRFDALNGEKTVSMTDNGKVYIGIREHYKNGLLSGERIFYYPDGTVKRKENYQAGRLSGTVSDYNDRGQLVHSATYSYNWHYGMEKWYGDQGKVIKTLQWQRDLPTGNEKYTYDGVIRNGAPYKNGLKQGIGTVPMGYKWNEQYRENSSGYPIELNWEDVTDIGLSHPSAYETVMFKDNLKTGKAIGMDAHSNDTLYVAYYENGLLDSMLTVYYRSSDSYYENRPFLTTNFINGIENGERTYRIPAGPLKDSIYRIETYQNGKLNGKLTQLFSKEPDQHIPPTDPGENPWAPHPIQFIPGEWYPDYHFITYKDDVRNGPFYFFKDSMNYNKGTYVNDREEGWNEFGTLFGTTWAIVKGMRSNNNKVGEWTTTYPKQNVTVIENYTNDRLDGTVQRSVNGKLAEERFYQNNTLQKIQLFDNAGNFNKFQIENETTEILTVLGTTKHGDTLRAYRYEVHKHDFKNSDTLLAVIAKQLINEEGHSIYTKGKFRIETPDYIETGILHGNSLQGNLLVEHKKYQITETITYEDRLPKRSSYLINGRELYTGTFHSAFTNEDITVHQSSRKGWSIQYDDAGNKISKTKYVNGEPKKTVRFDLDE